MPLVAEWNFEQAESPTIVDFSGNGHDLVWGAHASATAGYHGAYAALSFVDTQSELGAGAYGPYPGGSPQGNPVTVMFWGKIAAAADEVYISCLNTAGREDPFGIYVAADGSIQAGWYDDTNTLSPSPLSATTGLVADDTWAHIAAVFVPGTGATLYVNGVEATVQPWQSGGGNAFYGTWETLLVGSSRWGAGVTAIDDLRIYDEALSGGQIATLMNQPVGSVNGVRAGATTIDNLYLGTLPVERAYVGNVLVYEA